MTTRTYRFAVVGSGFVARLYVAAIYDCPNAQLGAVVVSDRSYRRRSDLAAQMGIGDTLFTTDLGGILGDSRIDVVILATPNLLHASQVRQCIEAGKPFIVEKPVVANYDQLREVLPLLRECPVKSLSGQVLRYSKIFQTAKSLTDSGQLGEIAFVASQYAVNAVGAVRRNAKPWWGSPANVEFAVLGAGVHSVDLMRWIAGEVEEVHAFGLKAVLKEQPYHDTVAATLRFRSGAVGELLVAFSAQRPAGVNLAIYGTQGTLLNNRLYVNDIPNIVDFIELPIPKLSFDSLDFPLLVRHMIECLEGECEPVSDAYDACKSAAVCLAIAKSIEDGGPVQVAELPGA